MDETRIHPFDRLMGMLEDLPDVVMSRPSTITTTTPVVGRVQTFIAQTVRQKDVGDFIFLQHIDADGSMRVVIPPRVSDTIARQRDALSSTARSKAAKAQYEARKAAGKVHPRFISKGPKATRKRRRSKR